MMEALKKRVEDASGVILDDNQFSVLFSYADRLIELYEEDGHYNSTMVFTMLQLLKFNNEWSNA